MTGTNQRENHGAAAAQSLIRKLTTEKAVKAHRQQTNEKAASEEDVTNIKLSSRGIKTIESLDLPSLRFVLLCELNERVRYLLIGDEVQQQCLVVQRVFGFPRL